MSWVVQGYRRFGRQTLADEWAVLPEWVSDQMISEGLGVSEDVRSGAWPISDAFVSRLEVMTDKKFRRRKRLARREYFVEFVADD